MNELIGKIEKNIELEEKTENLINKLNSFMGRLSENKILKEVRKLEDLSDALDYEIKSMIDELDDDEKNEVKDNLIERINLLQIKKDKLFLEVDDRVKVKEMQNIFGEMHRLEERENKYQQYLNYLIYKDKVKRINFIADYDVE